jgi:hypothetical protein
MGTWTIYDVPGRWSLGYSDYGGAPIGYTLVHDESVGTIDNLYSVGEWKRKLGANYFNDIFRFVSMFDTSVLTGLTVNAASIFVSAGVTAGVISKDLVLNIVKGSGISDVPVLADYGYLLSQTTSYGSLSIPSAGQAYNTWREVILNAGGLSEILTTGWTKYGWRTDDDISSVEPPDPAVATVWYVNIEIVNSMLSQVVVTNDATATLGTIHFSGELTEDFVTRRTNPKIVVTVDEGVNGSNMDVQFQYTGPVNGETGWYTEQEMDSEFTADVGSLSPGVYTYNARVRLKDSNIPGTYYYYSGVSKTIEVPPLSYPTNPITRVTSIVHTFNRILGEYKLQAGMGGVLAEFDIPTSVVTPTEAKKEEPPLAVPETVTPTDWKYVVPPYRPSSLLPPDASQDVYGRIIEDVPKGFKPTKPPTPITETTTFNAVQAGATREELNRLVGRKKFNDALLQGTKTPYLKPATKPTIVNTPTGEARKKTVEKKTDKFGKTRSAGEQYE